MHLHPDKAVSLFIATLLFFVTMSSAVVSFKENSFFLKDRFLEFFQESHFSE